MAPKTTGKKKATIASKRTPAPAQPVARVKSSAKKTASKPVSKSVKSSAKSTPVKPTARKVVIKKAAPTKSAPEKTVSVKKSPSPQPAPAHPPARKASIYQSQPILAPSADAPLSDEQLRKIKTGLNKKDLEHYAGLLWQKRREILGDVESLQSDRDAKNAGGDLSNMPLHMADVGSDNYEQEFTLHLVESERKLLREINDALLRIKKGIYGVCVESGRPIAKPRLDAKPWAKYCIEVAREKERQGRM